MPTEMRYDNANNATLGGAAEFRCQSAADRFWEPKIGQNSAAGWSTQTCFKPFISNDSWAMAGQFLEEKTRFFPADREISIGSRRSQSRSLTPVAAGL
ncbi:MAG: hypothetical protein JO081_10605 [Alphaproteobacteria bacterium]|nr:hypothetical protein [Alphaproteobacteria bacterium]